MYHLKNIVKASIASKELIKVLPLAMSHQNRSYSDHQIPERLQHIPTSKDPLFFDMASVPKKAARPRSNYRFFQKTRLNTSFTVAAKSSRIRWSRT